MIFHWRKLSPFPQQASIANNSLLWETPCSVFPLTAETLSGLNQHKSYVCSHNLCEFICIPLLLCLNDAVSLELSISWLAQFFYLFLTDLWVFKGGERLKLYLYLYNISHNYINIIYIWCWSCDNLLKYPHMHFFSSFTYIDICY